MLVGNVARDGPYHQGYEAAPMPPTGWAPAGAGYDTEACVRPPGRRCCTPGLRIPCVAVQALCGPGARRSSLRRREARGASWRRDARRRGSPRRAARRYAVHRGAAWHGAARNATRRRAPPRWAARRAVCLRRDRGQALFVRTAPRRVTGRASRRRRCSAGLNKLVAMMMRTLAKILN